MGAPPDFRLGAGSPVVIACTLTPWDWTRHSELRSGWSSSGKVMSRDRLDRSLALLALAGIVALGASMRLYDLGHPFVNADEVRLPWRILLGQGFDGFWTEGRGFLLPYGLLAWSKVLSVFGVPLTERMWTLPVALLGLLHLVLAYYFAVRLGCRRPIALGVALALSILPAHVLLSRYVLGQELVALVFMTIALWALLDFLERPGWFRGLAASAGCGLYLVSHHYIVPFFPCVLLLFVTVGRREHEARMAAGLRGIATSLKYGVWIFPLAVTPLLIPALNRTMEKPTELGIYLSAMPWATWFNMGAPLLLLASCATVAALLLRRLRSEAVLFFMLAAFIYVAPLYFGAPNDVVGDKREYSTMALYFWILGGGLVFERVYEWAPRVLWIVLVVLVAGIPRTIEHTQWALRHTDFEIGGIHHDPGTKTAGYLVQEFVPLDLPILCVHPMTTSELCTYYFDRKEPPSAAVGTEEQRIESFHSYADSVDAVVCGKDLVPLLEASNRFTRKLVVYADGEPRMWVYGTPKIDLPVSRADVEEYNERFDRKYTPRALPRTDPSHGRWAISVAHAG
jgi:hypothetical protein